MQCRPFTIKRQSGAIALMLLVIIAISTAVSFLIQELNSTRLQIERDKANAAVLAHAKDAVMGYALANLKTPGGLPFPDRKNDGNYDGDSDCFNGVVSAGLLLGKFPSGYEDGCFPVVRAFGSLPQDATGERLWYAVSKSLVRSSAGNFPIISTHSLMLNGEWMTVIDESGTVLSNQVAFILIAPGAILAGQNRFGAAPEIYHYLDNFIIGGINQPNWDADLVFVKARPVNDGSNRFNDRMLYVTRDEFIDRLLGRIVGEIRSRLDQHHATTSHYPYAAPLEDGECKSGITSRYIPTMDSDGDCGGAFVAFPAWWSHLIADPSKYPWQRITHYTYMAPDQYTIQFDHCASTFTVTWNATLNRGEIQRSGPC